VLRYQEIVPVLGARKRSKPFIIDMFYPGRVACQPVGKVLHQGLQEKNINK
jgi:hypothetical protein